MIVTQAVNTIIGYAARSASEKIFQIGTNKFFSTETNSELEPGLIGRKGFFFSLRHGLGMPLLNISSVAGALFEKNTVADFIRYYTGKRTGLADADRKALREVLKGVRGAIIHEQGRIRALPMSQLTVPAPRTSQ